MKVGIREKIDPVKYRELLIKAMGDRSLYQFAKEIGKPVATLSRIMKQQNTRSSSGELLQLIAEHSADSSVTLDELKLANGLPTEKNMMDSDELYGNSLLADKLEGQNPEAICRLHVPMTVPGFQEAEVDFIVDYPEIGKWMIDNEIITYRWAKHGHLYEELVFEQQLCRLITYSMLDARVGGDMVERFSLVVDVPECYKRLSGMLKDLQLKKCVSVIYVQMKGFKITKMEETCCKDIEGNSYAGIFSK